MELHYKTSNVDDIDRLLEIQKGHVLRYEDPTIVNVNDVLKRVEMNLRSNIESYTTVWIDDEIVGYYRMVEDYDFYYDLSFLYVLKEYRRQGIGTQIIEHLKQQADDPIHVTVLMNDTNVYDFLTNQNFQIKKIISKMKMILEYSH